MIGIDRIAVVVIRLHLLLVDVFVLAMVVTCMSCLSTLIKV